MTDRALGSGEIEARLEDLLDAVLSPRRSSAHLVAALAPLAREQQDFVLHWGEVINKSNPELAYHFLSRAADGLRLMEVSDVEAWVIGAMDVYDKLGLQPACAALDDLQTFAAEARDRVKGIAFEQAARVLALFVQGLSGRPLTLSIGEDVYTDTSTLFLPARVTRFSTREANFRLYKAMVAHLWAQSWYGTFRVDLVSMVGAFPDTERALRLFHALETIRLEARMAQDLPGLYRDFEELRRANDAPDYPASWQPAIERLRKSQATVHDTWAVLHEVYETEPPPALPYQGQLFPDRIGDVIAKRQAQEKEQLQAALAELLAQQDGRATQSPASDAPRFNVDRAIEAAQPNRGTFELSLDGKPVTMPSKMHALLDSIVQDFGAVPDDYLVASPDARYRSDSAAKKLADIDTQAEGTYLYNEWDYRRRHYRKDWCLLREIDVQPIDEPFVARTLQKYAGLAATLRKTFEALRGENRAQKRQKHGDDIDLDAVVEGQTELRNGHELNERLFLRTHKIERNIAVMFMVDMSGSTKGWINEAERESLVLLCEALEVLGDRYAIYGFSGITRRRCELYRVKRFDEPYTELVRRRITGMQPQDYTRMGVAIRHLTQLLHAVDARTKLLITLSDGKPDDYDGYRGDYGIEDTRQALLEAKRARIHPFCITIDTEARDYLPHMYGAANYTLIDDVRKLPFRVSDIYRHLTA